MRKTWIVTSAADMQKLRDRWESLHVAGRHTIFQSYTWSEMAARAFGHKESPLVAMAESDSGIAIIPACMNVKEKRLSLLGETLYDYRDTLTDGDLKPLHKAWSDIALIAAKHGCSFGFTALRSSPESKDRWAGFEQISFTSAPYILRRDREVSHRPRLDRNARRLAALGVVKCQYDGSAAQLLRAIYSLKSEESGSLFTDSGRIDLIIALAQSSPLACETFTFEQGSTLVAALVTFRDGVYRRFYTTYFNEAWSRFSPGMTLLHEAVQSSLAEGLNCDLLTGDHHYKRRLTTASAPLVRVEASAGQVRAGFRHTVAHAA